MAAQTPVGLPVGVSDDIEAEVIARHHSPQLAHRGDGAQLDDRLVVSDRTIPSDDDGLVQGERSVLHGCRQMGQLPESASHGDEVIGASGGHAGPDRQPVGDGHEPAIGPPARSEQLGRKRYQPGVGRVEPAGEFRDTGIDGLAVAEPTVTGQVRLAGLMRARRRNLRTADHVVYRTPVRHTGPIVNQ